MTPSVYATPDSHHTPGLTPDCSIASHMSHLSRRIDALEAELIRRTSGLLSSMGSVQSDIRHLSGQCTNFGDFIEHYEARDADVKRAIAALALDVQGLQAECLTATGPTRHVAGPYAAPAPPADEPTPALAQPPDGPTASPLPAGHQMATPYDAGSPARRLAFTDEADNPLFGDREVEFSEDDTAFSFYSLAGGFVASTDDEHPSPASSVFMTYPAREGRQASPAYGPPPCPPPPGFPADAEWPGYDAWLTAPDAHAVMAAHHSLRGLPYTTPPPAPVASAVVGRGRQPMPSSYVQGDPPRPGHGPLPAPAPTSIDPTTYPVLFQLPTSITEAAHSRLMAGEDTGIVYALNKTVEAGVSVQVGSAVTVVASTMLDTGSSLFFLSASVFAQLQLTPRPSAMHVRHVAGISTDLVESAEEVALVLAGRTPHQTRHVFKNTHWLRVPDNDAFQVLISAQALERFGGVLAPPFNALAWYPGWARRDLSVCMRLPLIRRPTHIQPAPAAAAQGSVPARNGGYDGPATTLSGLNWGRMVLNQFSFVAAQPLVSSRRRMRRHAWLAALAFLVWWCDAAFAMLLRLCNDVEENPGP